MNNNGYLLTNAYQFEFMESQLSPPDVNYVQIEFLYCSICGGDYSQYIGRRKYYPISLGHEFVGRVRKLGSHIKNLQVGDFVISDFNYRCQSCHFCKSNKSHLCDHNDIQKFTNRGFFKYANIHSSYLYKLNLNNDLYIATLIEPLSCVIHAIDGYDLNSISSIFVNGAGSIGMLFSFYLQNILHKKVYINDTNTARQAKLIKYFHCYKLEDDEVYDLIVDSTNSISGLKQSLIIARKGQKICIMSHLYGEDTSFVYEMACKKELELKFPLRNGDSNTILLSEKYLKFYWKRRFNPCLSIHHFEDLPIVFKNKMTFSSNKQIIKLSEAG